MEGIMAQIKGNARKYTMFIAFAAIVVVFQIWTDGVLLVPQNVTNLIQQNSYVVILAVGMLMCILAGGYFDLSVGSLVGLVGAVAAKMCVEGSYSPVLAIAVALLMGILSGAIIGYLISYMGVPAYVVTLAGMFIYRGLCQAVLAGRTLSPFPAGFQVISTGFLPDFFNVEGLHMTSVVIGIVVAVIVVISAIRNRIVSVKQNARVSSLPFFIVKTAVIAGVIVFLCYWLAKYEGIPNVMVLLVALIGFYTFFTNQTVMGRHLYAMGGNAKAAQLSGIKTKRLLLTAFINMGFLAALAGVVFAGRLNAATPKAGNSFEMDAIASCYIGGASSSGGVGTVAGAVIGALIMGVLNNGMSIIGIDVDWQQVIKGLVLLVAVIFDTLNKRNEKR